MEIFEEVERDMFVGDGVQELVNCVVGVVFSVIVNEGCQCDEGFAEPMVIPVKTLLRKEVICVKVNLYVNEELSLGTASYLRIVGDGGVK